MATNREVLAGETIAFRVRFRDDLGEETEASDVYVHIFDPNGDTDDLGTAVLVSGVAVDLGENIWEFQYTVPLAGPAGTWHDQWEGDITLQGVDETFSFTVVNSGIIEDLGTQLNNNNVVTVTLEAGIAATDGTSLEQDFEFGFLTPLTPAYASLRKVHIEAGGYIGNIPDDTVMLAILEASLEADAMHLQQTQTTDTFLHARRQYTTCLAALMLIGNLGTGMKSKTLGDLSVTYDTNSLRDSLQRFYDCLAKWEPQIISGGNSRSAGAPAGVVKGEKDVDRPIVSRDWEPASNGTPAANTRRLPAKSRRYIRTWSRIPGFKKWW